MCLLAEQSGINVNTKDQEDWTPLSFPAGVGESKAMHLLLE